MVHQWRLSTSGDAVIERQTIGIVASTSVNMVIRHAGMVVRNRHINQVNSLASANLVDQAGSIKGRGHLARGAPQHQITTMVGIRRCGDVASCRAASCGMRFRRGAIIAPAASASRCAQHRVGIAWTSRTRIFDIAA